MAKCSGGHRTFLFVGYFLKIEAFRMRTVNRALKVHTTLYNSALTKIYILIFMFTMYQNYPHPQVLKLHPRCLNILTKEQPKVLE